LTTYVPNGTTDIIILLWLQPTLSLVLLLYWGFLMTHIYTHGRTPLDEWPACRRDLYLHRTTQHINTTDKHTCPQRDSNQWSQQRSGRRPTAYTALPMK
jgi:hypothetical protein